MHTDEIVFLRSQARAAKQWSLSDQLRSELLTRNVIVTDTKDGQDVVYLSNKWTVEGYLKRQEEDRKAEAMFEAWLFTQRERIAKASVR